MSNIKKPITFMVHGDTTQYVTIPLSEYNELKESDKFLDILHAHSVEIWEGYNKASQIMYNEEE